MESPKVHRERERRGSAGCGTQKRALAKQNSMNKKIKKLTIVLGWNSRWGWQTQKLLWQWKIWQWRLKMVAHAKVT